jgi:hypothetical protein
MAWKATRGLGLLGTIASPERRGCALGLFEPQLRENKVAAIWRPDLDPKTDLMA